MEYSLNPFERIKQYQSNKKNLFKCDDPQRMAEEIMETYSSATKPRYKMSILDKNIRFEAMIIRKPEFLETVIKRLENDEIIDFEGNPVKDSKTTG